MTDGSQRGTPEDALADFREWSSWQHYTLAALTYKLGKEPQVVTETNEQAFRLEPLNGGAGT